MSRRFPGESSVSVNSDRTGTQVSFKFEPGSLHKALHSKSEGSDILRHYHFRSPRCAEDPVGNGYTHQYRKCADSTATEKAALLREFSTRLQGLTHAWSQRGHRVLACWRLRYRSRGPRSKGYVEDVQVAKIWANVQPGSDACVKITAFWCKSTYGLC